MSAVENRETTIHVANGIADMLRSVHKRESEILYKAV